MQNPECSFEGCPYAQAIGRIEGKLDVGFDNILKRLDSQNGRIGRTEDSIKDLSEKIVPDGRRRMIAVEGSAEKNDRKLYIFSGVALIGGPILVWAFKALAQQLGVQIG